MSDAGEEGHVSSVTLESWKERSRELVRGWKQNISGTLTVLQNILTLFYFMKRTLRNLSKNSY